MLIKKGATFEWNKKCRRAFDKLKSAFVSAPILAHYDPAKQTFVECDSSDYVTSGILSQMGDDGALHPVAFMSKKLDCAECNYEIYDKELLAIVRYMETWRPELSGTEHPFTVISDHKNLEYFIITKQLTR